MTMYDIQPDVKWPQQLGRVIQSYAQGQERSRLLKMAEEEARQKQAERQANIDKVKLLTVLMRKFAGGGKPLEERYGVPGGKIGPPEEGGSGMPGLELSGFGPGGPSFKVGGMSIEDALSMGIGSNKGYEKPTIRTGPRGRVSGMTYAPKAQQYPAGFKEDLANAVSVVSRGADPLKVFRRISAAYPGQSTELKRILLYTPTAHRLEAFKELLFGGTQ